MRDLGDSKELLEAMPDGVIVSDENGRILFANRRAEALSGYSREELAGRSIEDLVPSRLRADHMRNRAHYLAGDPVPRMMGTRLDIRMRRKDGREFPADIALGPIGIRRGRMVLETMRDVTERQRLDAELHRAREVQQRMEERERIGRELHDGTIQMLFSLGMKVQTLESATRDDQTKRELDDVAGNIDEIIRDIRNYISDLRPGVLAVQTLEQALHEIAAGSERDTDIAVAVRIGVRADHPLLTRHAGDLIQVTREALANVRHHAEARSCQVTLTERDGGLMLEVRDDGRGFDPARSGGKGWGLRNLRDRALAVGGRLDIESAPGTGTTVRITIPRVNAAALST